VSVGKTAAFTSPPCHEVAPEPFLFGIAFGVRIYTCSSGNIVGGTTVAEGRRHILVLQRLLNRADKSLSTINCLPSHHLAQLVQGRKFGICDDRFECHWRGLRKSERESLT
jgi:hypothetical protein